MNAFRTAMAVMGTFVAIAAAVLSATYAAFVVLPFCLVLGYVALWSISRSRSVRVPISVAIVGAFCLISPTVVYIGNEGNWNQPGTQWLLVPLLVGIVLLGANALAIYVRYVAGSLATFVGGPANSAGTLGYASRGTHSPQGRVTTGCFRRLRPPRPGRDDKQEEKS